MLYGYIADIQHLCHMRVQDALVMHVNNMQLVLL